MNQKDETLILDILDRIRWKVLEYNNVSISLILSGIFINASFLSENDRKKLNNTLIEEIGQENIDKYLIIEYNKPCKNYILQ